MAAFFDERSGIVPCKTPWGCWWQTVEEVYIEVNLSEPIKSKQIKCDITTSSLSLSVADKTFLKGDLPHRIHTDESVWTLEDKKLIRIVLEKANAGALHCWKSLLVDQYEADPWTQQEMEKKITLQRFQSENPGMDFSGAEVTGNYQGGGPKLSQ